VIDAHHLVRAAVEEPRHPAEPHASGSPPRADQIGLVELVLRGLRQILAPERDLGSRYAPALSGSSHPAKRATR